MKLLTAKEENDQLFVNGYTSVTKANPDDLDFEPSKGPQKLHLTPEILVSALP